VCESFEDYSASEIELLTRKYIDLLMNSNFTCDTWRNPINYHRSENFVEKHAEQVDNSDCVSDVEPQEDDKVLSTTIESENVVAEDNVDKSKVKSPAKSNLKQIESTFSSFTTLESAIATLVDAEPGEQRNFGAINISEVLNNSSNSVSEKDKDQINQSHEQTVNNKNQRILCLSEKHSSEQDTILVNGTTMYACPACNRIFMTENLLRQHQAVNHKGNTTSTDSSESVCTSTSKSSAKPKSQISSGSCTKKPVSAKCKRKLRCSESLKCTICSVTFDSKEVLFDHIMTHSEQELQEAYKTAKAKAKQQQQSEGSNSMSEESDKDVQHVADDSQNNETQKKKTNDKNKRKKSTDSSNRSSRSSMDVEDLLFEDPLKTTCTGSAPVTVSVQQQVRFLLVI
jgi:hypothetical protein